MSEAAFKLEYWIDKRNYSKEGLENKLSQDLEKLNTKITIKAKSDYYVITIQADKYNIDACHDHLNFDREEIFRAKDELGDELRSKAYPILAEIETRLRRFITRAMIEVLGFNWWDRSTPKKIKKNVSRIEKQSGSKQAEDHHQIEFTMFDDLITFVTGKYQKWADEKNLTPADLAELLDDCENIEELKEKLSQNREQTSLWEDVFSYYFDDKEAWDNLEKKIQQIVIPIRHKVMHHRLIGIYDVRELEECRDEFNKIIGTAKTKLAQKEFQDAFKAVLNNKLFKIDPDVLKVLNQSLIDPEIFKEFRRSVQIDPEIIQAITKTPLIDPEIMRRFTSGINFRIQGFDNEPTSGEDEGNEEDSNGNEKNDQNEEDKPDDNDKEDKNDSSEDDKNGENDKEGET